MKMSLRIVSVMFRFQMITSRKQLQNIAAWGKSFGGVQDVQEMNVCFVFASHGILVNPGLSSVTSAMFSCKYAKAIINMRIYLSLCLIN
jgi:hypothetical protein